MTRRLLYLGPPDTVEWVRQHLPAFEVSSAHDDASVERVFSNCHAVLDASMKVRFPAERLARAEQLRLFVTATTGADHVDVAALEGRGIPLLTLRGQRDLLRNLTPAAEHSWLLLMACARQLLAATRAVLDGEWDRNQFPGIMLRGKTLGIVGCGRIGEWMSRYATAFGMHCLGCDPHLQHVPDTIRPCGLQALLSESDFVTVHVPLNDETRGMFDVRAFQAMKPGVVFVNTSRGDITDEAALLQALQEGRVAAAGIDVLVGEPDIRQHPLLAYARAHPHLIITPHIGGYSPDALREVLTFSCRRIGDFFAAQT